MVEQRKEATVEPSKTLRMLAATAVVSALAILLASPAQASFISDGGAGPVAAPSVGNPADSAWIAVERAAAAQTVANQRDDARLSPSPIDEPTVTSGGSDGLETGTFVAIAGGALLVLGAGALLLLTARHRRVALP